MARISSHIDAISNALAMTSIPTLDTCLFFKHRADEFFNQSSAFLDLLILEFLGVLMPLAVLLPKLNFPMLSHACFSNTERTIFFLFLFLFLCILVFFLA